MGDQRTELLELLDWSGASLLALLTRLTLRQDMAEELMQDLFLKLSAAKDQGSIDCWYAYARRTAINLAFDWRRRERIRQVCSLDESLDCVSPASSPLSALIEAEAGGDRRLSKAFPEREALLVVRRPREFGGQIGKAILRRSCVLARPSLGERGRSPYEEARLAAWTDQLIGA